MPDSSVPLEHARALRRAALVESWAESARLSNRITEAVAALERSFRLRAEGGEIHAVGRTTYWL